MTDEQTIALLRRAGEAATHDRHLDTSAATRAWALAQPPPRRARRYFAVAATVLGVAGGATALAVTQTGDQSAAPPAAASACAGNISTAALPAWARSGFRSAGLHTPHVLGRHREIVAVLFVDLRVQPPRGTKNKILWVARDGGGPVHIRARLEGSTQEATRTVPDGPSYVDMPAAGCWQMTLTWPGHRDEMALHYAP
jgi:hypothetical protein